MEVMRVRPSLFTASEVGSRSDNVKVSELVECRKRGEGRKYTRKYDGIERTG